MWWHGGAGLIERSERGSLSAVATHDVFCKWVLQADLSVLPDRRRNSSASFRARRDLLTTASTTDQPMAMKSPTGNTMSGRSRSMLELIAVATSSRSPDRRIRISRNSRAMTANFASVIVLESVSFIVAYWLSLSAVCRL